MRELTGNTGHRALKPVPTREPYEVVEGPEGIRQRLMDQGRWHSHSAGMLADYEALDEARAKATTPIALVRVADARRRILRDLGALDDDVPAQVPANQSPARWMT